MLYEQIEGLNININICSGEINEMNNWNTKWQLVEVKTNRVWPIELKELIDSAYKSWAN